MTSPAPIVFQPEKSRNLAAIKGILVVFADGEGKLGPAAAAVDAASGGALGRTVADPDFKAKPGAVRILRFPSGMAAKAVVLACLGKAPDRAAARKTGGAIAKALGKGDVTLCTTGAARDDLVAELGSLITDVLDANPDFERILGSFFVNHEEKEAIIDRALGSQASPFHRARGDRLRGGGKRRCVGTGRVRRQRRSSFQGEGR